MSDLTKQITNLKKQNDGMEISFKNKGITFTKLSIDTIDPETELKLLKDYNEYLHLWTFKTPTFALKKYKKCKINIDGLTFSSSLWLVKK